ncbi:MAG: hypothetical protein JWN50_8 [Parcubacteria group bacterium]|nr:hypothetical protein [Parcubacteria group bacterium]
MARAAIMMRYKRAQRIVFPGLLKAYYRKDEPYDKHLVQDAKNLPDGLIWGSREHALYLWFLCIYMKGGINSQVAITQLSKLYTDHQWIFMPENLLGLDKLELRWVIEWLGTTLQEYGLGSNVEESKRTWVWNSVKLAKFWNSDPRDIFREAEKNAEASWQSYEAAKANYDALARLIIRKPGSTHETIMSQPNGFYGFQHKMVSMIIYFFIHAGILVSFPYPVPVDFHILRVLISTGILGIRKRTERRWGSRHWEFREKFLPYAREVTLRYVVEERANPQHLADVLWILSRSWCRHHPGNKSSVEKTRTARRRHITDLPVVWNASTERRYDRTCGRCPIENECRWNIPSSYYYVKGCIVLRSARIRPPQYKLLDVPVTSVRMNRRAYPKAVRRPPPVLADIHQSTFL